MDSRYGDCRRMKLAAILVSVLILSTFSTAFAAELSLKAAFCKTPNLEASLTKAIKAPSVNTVTAGLPSSTSSSGPKLAMASCHVSNILDVLVVSSGRDRVQGDSN